MLTQTYFSDTEQWQTIPQHHLKAAEHLDSAARAHQEAATLLASGEPKAADLRIRIARDHVLKAGLQVIKAENKMNEAGYRRLG